jgi:hypothetical protein
LRFQLVAIHLAWSLPDTPNENSTEGFQSRIRTQLGSLSGILSYPPFSSCILYTIALSFQVSTRFTIKCAFPEKVGRDERGGPEIVSDFLG